MIRTFLDYLNEAIEEDQYGGGFGGGSVGPVTDTTSPIHGRDIEEDNKSKKKKPKNED